MNSYLVCTVTNRDAGIGVVGRRGRASYFCEVVQGPRAAGPVSASASANTARKHTMYTAG